MYSRFTRILVVDDSEVMRRIVSKMLMDLGFHFVDHAVDGSSALKKLTSARYGLVISDWAMQPMNGEQLLHEIRKLRLLQHLPFLMMTAHTVKFADVGRGGGSFFFLKKPFKVETLAETLTNMAALDGRSARVGQR